MMFVIGKNATNLIGQVELCFSTCAFVCPQGKEVTCSFISLPTETFSLFIYNYNVHV